MRDHYTCMYTYKIAEVLTLSESKLWPVFGQKGGDKSGAVNEVGDPDSFSVGMVLLTDWAQPIQGRHPDGAEEVPIRRASPMFDLKALTKRHGCSLHLQQ